MRVSGFSIIRDGSRFGYPFVESIRSILPVVDEFVIAVGHSRDDTLARVQAIDSPKLRILETVWDPEMCRGGEVLACQTNLALDACQGDWCFYLQGDEVIHERDHDAIRSAMHRYVGRPGIEGLTFRYHHFHGGYNLVNPLAYRRQVRIVRNGVGVRSVGDACGFGIEGRKLATKPTGGWVYHYGWARPPQVMAEKTAQFEQFYIKDNGRASVAPPEGREVAPHAYDCSMCAPFRGAHPAVVREIVARQEWPTPEFRDVPWWRNRVWWRHWLRKNFKSLPLGPQSAEA
jgi:hypothetical protein